MPLSDTDRRRLNEALEEERRAADFNSEPANEIRKALRKLMDRPWIQGDSHVNCQFAADKAYEAFKIGDAPEFATRFCEFADSMENEMKRAERDDDDFLDRISEARLELKKFHEYVDEIMKTRNLKEYMELSARAKSALGRLVK